MSKLRDLGHPEYLETTDKIYCCGEIEFAKQKVCAKVFSI